MTSRRRLNRQLWTWVQYHHKLPPDSLGRSASGARWIARHDRMETHRARRRGAS